MLPFGTLKLTSRNTTWSSKANETLLNTTTGEFGSGRGFDAVAALEESDKKGYLPDSI